jgi:hypothetical protein
MLLAMQILYCDCICFIDFCLSVRPSESFLNSAPWRHLPSPTLKSWSTYLWASFKLGNFTGGIGQYIIYAMYDFLQIQMKCQGESGSSYLYHTGGLPVSAMRLCTSFNMRTCLAYKTLKLDVFQILVVSGYPVSSCGWKMASFGTVMSLTMPGAHQMWKFHCCAILFYSIDAPTL